jgi:serine/threonine-protein kinase SRPK3
MVTWSALENTQLAIISTRALLRFRYVVVKKLGWGHFSTVWMVKDRKIQTAGHNNHFYALKVQKSAEHYTEAAMDEVELLDCIASERRQCEADLLSNSADKEACQLVEHSRFVATLHDHFFHTGPNGRHMCMLFSMLGCNLLSVIKAFNYRGIPIDVVKKMTAGVCMGLDFLHRRCHIIHTDLKP